MPTSSQNSAQNTNNERPRRMGHQPKQFRDAVPDDAWLSQGENFFNVPGGQVGLG